jgi:GNAT superfamily N-acetyltransferase
VKVKRVTEGDADRVTELLGLAFFEDPTWGWAFPDEAARAEQHRRLWALCLRSSVPYGWVTMTEDGGAAASWIPPGKPELTDEDDAEFEALVRELPGSHVDDVLTLKESFDANHPMDQEHFYLSLLGTHPDHRGQGKGMALLAANLEEIDELGMPAFLHSTNRGNDHRYERHGFELIGEFAAPGGEPTIGCMWREPR